MGEVKRARLIRPVRVVRSHLVSMKLFKFTEVTNFSAFSADITLNQQNCHFHINSDLCTCTMYIIAAQTPNLFDQPIQSVAVLRSRQKRSKARLKGKTMTFQFDETLFLHNMSVETEILNKKYKQKSNTYHTNVASIYPIPSIGKSQICVCIAATVIVEMENRAGSGHDAHFGDGISFATPYIVDARTYINVYK